MSEVIEVTDSTFQQEVLKSEVPTEVDFWAPWCAPCRMVSPIYDKLAKKYGDFKFCKINIDEHRSVAQEYQVMSIPMQMFFADGKKVDQLLGAVPEEVIRDKVEEILQRFPTDEKGRLKVILSSWVDHNTQDVERFRTWTDKAQQSKTSPLYEPLLQVAAELEDAKQKLSELLHKL